MPKSDAVMAFFAVLLFTFAMCQPRAGACPEKPKRCDTTCRVDSGGHQICKTVCR